MTGSARPYVPAAGRDWLLPLYDPLLRLLGAHRYRSAMLDAAALAPGMRVLDVGCGTGSLVAALAGGDRGVTVAGLDPDPLALERARYKLEHAGLSATLERGYADELPYDDGAFERVFSSFMFHHLEQEVKEAMLREVRRVLAPGGTFHLTDFVGVGHSHGWFAGSAHGHGTHDATESSIPSLMRAAGFSEVHEVSRGRLLLARVTHYEAR